MCWFRPASAVALDCAATRAGDSAWADRPGLPHRLAEVLCNAARNAAMHAFTNWPWCAQGVTRPRRPDEPAARLSPYRAEVDAHAVPAAQRRRHRSGFWAVGSPFWSSWRSRRCRGRSTACTGADGGQLGHRGQPRAGQPGPACRSRDGHRQDARPRYHQAGCHHRSCLRPRALARAVPDPHTAAPADGQAQTGASAAAQGDGDDERPAGLDR